MNSGNIFQWNIWANTWGAIWAGHKIINGNKKVKTFKQTSGALNHKRGKTGQEKKKEKPSEFENLIETRNSG